MISFSIIILNYINEIWLEWLEYIKLILVKRTGIVEPWQIPWSASKSRKLGTSSSPMSHPSNILIHVTHTTYIFHYLSISDYGKLTSYPILKAYKNIPTPRLISHLAIEHGPFYTWVLPWRTHETWWFSIASLEGSWGQWSPKSPVPTRCWTRSAERSCPGVPGPTCHDGWKKNMTHAQHGSCWWSIGFPTVL